MSTRKKKNKKKFSFIGSWERIRKATDIENFLQLSEIIETSQSNITKRKNEDNFPIEWAFFIGEKYGISTEWILTGKGFKENNSFFSDLEEWAKITGGSENNTWLENIIYQALPTFKKWIEEKEKSEGDKNKFPSTKIA